MNDWIDDPCPCVGPGWCPHYNLTLGDKLYELTHLPGEDGKGWRRQLAEQTQSRRTASTAPPSLLEQAASFGKAVAQHAASGFKQVEPEERERRLAVCRGCEFFREAENRCLKCGCHLGPKTSWATASCPIGKW